jgi:hypothetical protein
MRRSTGVAAAIALVVVLTGCGNAQPSAPPATPSAPLVASQPAGNEAWSRIPIPPDPALARAAYSACVPAGGPQGHGDLPLVVQDQRGPGAAFFIWAGGDARVSCLAAQQSDGSIKVLAGFGSTGHGVGTRLDFWGLTQDAPYAIGGDTGPGRHVFIQLADGSSFEASRGGGLFGAWWPQPVQAIAISSVDDLGRVVETQELTASSP